MSDEIDENVFDFELIEKIIQNRVNTSKVDFKKEKSHERLKVINTLFKIFISMYGKNFADQYDNDFTKDIWFNALLVFDKQEIANGIEKVLQDEYVSAPNLKRFILYCSEPMDKKENTQRLPTLYRGVNTY